MFFDVFVISGLEYKISNPFSLRLTFESFSFYLIYSKACFISKEPPRHELLL